VGVRIPDHPTVRALLAERDEPILSSTLILPGETEPLNNADDIAEAIGRRIDAILDSGPCSAQPTTVIDLALSPPTIVRRGLGDPSTLGLDWDQTSEMR
jgi:tRNA A37 threonylcarbamoyladenosine synthetase subunit TsaC/SUA5/YrdC